MKHRTALVSAMSIAGVVLAGATAVGANLGILNSSQGLGEISAVEPVTTSTPVTTPAGTPPTVPDAQQSDLVAYQINGVGVVTIARQGSDLKLESADVGDWSYEVSGQGEALTMAFRFEEREVQFEAALTDGKIVVDVWEEQVIVGTAASSGSAPATAPATQATSVTIAPPVTSGTWDDDDHDDDDGRDGDDHSYDDDDDSHESDDDDGGDDDD